MKNANRTIVVKLKKCVLIGVLFGLFLPTYISFASELSPGRDSIEGHKPEVSRCEAIDLQIKMLKAKNQTILDDGIRLGWSELGLLLLSCFLPNYSIPISAFSAVFGLEFVLNYGKASSESLIQKIRKKSTT